MRPALVVVALALVAAAPAAQIDSKEASKQLKASAKAHLAELKAELEVDRDAALVTIESYELAFATGGWQPVAAATLFEDLSDYIGLVAGHVSLQAESLADDATALLDQITDEDVVAGAVPQAFGAGLGSTFDDTRSKMLLAAAKAEAVVFKRLGKTVKLLDKAGVNVVIVRRPLAPTLVDFAPALGGTLAVPQCFDMKVDLAMSFSTDEAADDGVLGIAGMANPLKGDVLIFLGEEEAQVAPTPQLRWSHVFGLEKGEAVPEGNKFLQVTPFNGGHEDTLVIAVI